MIREIVVVFNRLEGYWFTEEAKMVNWNRVREEGLYGCGGRSLVLEGLWKGESLATIKHAKTGSQDWDEGNC